MQQEELTALLCGLRSELDLFYGRIDEKLITLSTRIEAIEVKYESLSQLPQLKDSVNRLSDEIAKVNESRHALELEVARESNAPKSNAKRIYAVEQAVIDLAKKVDNTLPTLYKASGVLGVLVTLLFIILGVVLAV